MNKSDANGCFLGDATNRWRGPERRLRVDSRRSLDRPRITAWGGEETFFTMLRSDESLEVEAPLGGFSVDKILGWASLYRWASSLRPMTW